ncbi:MAG: hypothetical protein QM755_07935 [Luteolibacter sp.]
MSSIVLRRSKAAATGALAVVLPASDEAKKNLSAPLAAALKDIPIGAKDTRTLVDTTGRITVVVGIAEEAGTAALRLAAVLYAEGDAGSRHGGFHHRPHRAACG